jgi:hypothetical protein
MSVELIVSRSGRKNFEHMGAIYDYCVATFGKHDCFVTWDVSFADNTDDWVAFKFWDEKLATMLKLVYPEMLSREEFENRRWEIS